MSFGLVKFVIVSLVQDSKMEGFISRGYSRPFNASYWARNAAYKSGYLHTYARCCISVTLRDQKQTVWKNLQATHLGAW